MTNHNEFIEKINSLTPLRAGLGVNPIVNKPLLDKIDDLLDALIEEALQWLREEEKS